MLSLSFLTALGNEGIDSQKPVDVAQVARMHVESALGDWDRVLEFERQFGAMSFENPAEQSRVNRSLYEVYQKWASDAEQVLVRTRPLLHNGCRIENAEALEHAFGRVQARLKMTPEMFDRAREQIRQGQGIAMQELRNGIRARVRA